MNVTALHVLIIGLVLY